MPNWSFKRLKPDYIFVIWIVIFFIGFSIGLVTNSSGAHPLTIPEWVFTAISTVVAAFGGSYFAFQLQRGHEARKRETDNLLSANRALFEIGQALNSLIRIKHQMLDPYEKSTIRAFEIRPVFKMDRDKFQVDFHSLGFLLATKHINVLGNIEAAFQDYYETIDVINEHSRLHYEEIQPLVSKAGIRHGAGISPGALKAAMGIPLFDKLVVITDSLYESVSDSIGILVEQFDDLRKASSDILKTEALIKQKRE